MSLLRNLILLLSFILSLNGVDINPNTIKEIIRENPKDINNRLLLAKYYIEKSNFNKATRYIDEVLKIDPKSKMAKNLREKIKIKKRLSLLLKKYQIDDINDKEAILKILKELYNQGKYKEYTTFYSILDRNSITSTYLGKNEKINASRIYVWNGKYNRANKIIKKLFKKYPKNMDLMDLKAQICFYTAKYSCSARYYQILYNGTGQKEYALKLLESYYYSGDRAKAKAILNKLKRYYPNNKIVKRIMKSIKREKIERLKRVKELFEKNPNYQTLKAYTGVLFEYNMKDDAIEITKNYIERNRKDIPSQVLYANYLSWVGRNREAVEYLKKIVRKDDYDIKLKIGKFLSWDSQFEEAISYLEDVVKNSKDKKLIYEAKKSLAFCDLWQNRKKEAKEKFNELLKLNPKDKDVKNALLNLSDNPNILIKVYKNKLKKEPKNVAYMLELARLYHRIGNEQKALYYYEKYYKIHPEDIEVAKSMAELYLKKKNVYRGFGLLEYYAYTKDTPEALIYLAKNYYWNGFNQEAIDVLDKLLKDSPHNREAKELRAKILKIAPSYTRSNSGATIEEHLGKVANSNLTLAYRLYDNYFYQASLTYFRNYFKEKPDDYKAREKYAYALEFSGFHKDAAGEFFLMFWQKNTPELKYHYAYNLMKAGKLKEAKKIFLELKKEVFSPAPEFIKAFLKGWESAWESQDFDRYKKFYSKKMLRNTTWVVKRQFQFKKAPFIAVAIYDPMTKRDKKGRYITKFYQEFATKGKGDKGYKTLYIRCDKNNQNCKIERESWKKGKYNTTKGLAPLIDDALKYIKNPPPLISLRAKRAKNSKLKITKVKDLYFPPKVGKDLEKENEVFGTVYLTESKIKSFDELFKSNNGKLLPIYALEKSKYESKYKNRIGVTYLSFSDSDKISSKKSSIYYERKDLIAGVDIKVDIGEFELKKKIVV